MPGPLRTFSDETAMVAFGFFAALDGAENWVAVGESGAGVAVAVFVGGITALGVSVVVGMAVTVGGKGVAVVVDISLTATGIAVGVAKVFSCGAAHAIAKKMRAMNGRKCLIFITDLLFLFVSVIRFRL